MKCFWKKLGAFFALALLPAASGAQTVLSPLWVATDSTLVATPHGDLAQTLQLAPAGAILAAGGHGQPAFFSAGFGDVFGEGVFFDGLEQDSYLFPFFDALRWSPAFLGEIALPDPNRGNSPGLPFHASALHLQSFWKTTSRPFVRVHYLTHDFGREEVFALFQKQVNAALRVQPFGAIGNYSGWLANSALHFQQTGFQAEKRLPSQKHLHLFAFSGEFEAGFPGGLSAWQTPVFSRLKRKVLEQRFQGTLSDSGAAGQSWKWQVWRLREEWTNWGPYFHRANEEISGALFWKTAGQWGKHTWTLTPGGRVSRIRYRSEVRTAWKTSLQFCDFFSIFPDWQAQARAGISAGNWGLRSFSLAAGLAAKKWGKPAATLELVEHHGGFLPPVLRDSTSFHWSWLRATPLFRAAQQGVRQRDFRLVQETLALPLPLFSGGKAHIFLQGIHWLALPGSALQTGNFHAANLGLWGKWPGTHGFSAEGVANFRAASTPSTLLTSALPAMDASGSVGFRHIFFQGDLHAAVKLIGRFQSVRQANVSSRIGKPVFVHLPAAGFLDFYAHFRVADLRFFFALENILDNADESLPGYPVPGRHFRFGLVWDFWN